MKLDSYQIPQTKADSKWVKHLNMRPKTIKPLEENMEEKLDIEFGKDFLDVTSKVQATKVKTEKLDHITLKPSVTEYNQQNIKATYGVGKKNHASDEGLRSIIYTKKNPKNKKQKKSTT